MDQVYPDHRIQFHFKINRNLFYRSSTSHQFSSSPDLEFADDAVLITPSRKAAHIALSTFAAVATSFGLTVNFIKTKVMGCGAAISAEDCRPFPVSGQVVESVDSFVYLGSLLSPDGRFSAEIDRRLASAA